MSDRLPSVFTNPSDDTVVVEWRYAIEDVQPGLLGRLRDSLDRPPVHDDVGKNGRCRDVVVPDPVMHELVMPLARAGFQIERDQRLAEQSRPRTMATVVIACGQLH